MGTTIGVDALASTVAKLLDEYGTLAKKVTNQAGQKAAQKGAKTLRATSPKGGKAGKAGTYAKGWTVQTFGGVSGNLYVIGNPSQGQLSHLLENGHALRQGGRSPAITHIAPVEQQAIKEFEENVRKGLSSV